MLISTYLARIVLSVRALRSELRVNNVPSTYLSDNQEEVLSAVHALREENDGPVRTSQVRERTGKGSSHTSDLLGDLVDLGKLVKIKRGIYDLPEFTDDEQVDRQTPQSDDASSVSEWPVDHGRSRPRSTDSTSSLEVDDRLIRSYLGYVPDPDEAFFCQIEGDSMQPWLSEGEYVFALRTEEVTVPSRYVIWWGGEEAQICVHLTPVGKSSGTEGHVASNSKTEDSCEGGSPENGDGSGRIIQLTQHSPQETLQLRSVSDGIYETGQGNQVQMQIRGRVIWPPSTAQNILETVTDQMRKIFDQTMSS